MKKILVGLLICIPLLILTSYTNYRLLLESKVVIIFIMGTIASYYQADYNPLKGDNVNQDKGTVLQIVWTVYITQALALLEAFYINSKTAFSYDYFSFAFLAVALFGLVFRSWAYITLGKFFTMHLQVKDDQALIEHGPYRYLRHPSYTGAFLTYTFIPLFLGSYRSAFLSIILLLMAFYRRINQEEKMLEQHLGDSYRIFCLKRSRLIPFIW